MAQHLVGRYYGLLITVNAVDGEIWGCADIAAHDALLIALQAPRNSPEWHHARAQVCGIPTDRIDTHYHERAGHGTRCEPALRGDATSGQPEGATP